MSISTASALSISAASSPLNLWWAGPDAAQDYRPELLRACDVPRAASERSPRADREWRVSRALLQQALARHTHADNELTVSLSHKHGHALAVLAPAGWRVGVDLEHVRARDVQALAKWCCTPQETRALLMREGSARDCFFYVLWTIKEAMVKAADLDFPADMRSVGLSPDGVDGPEGQGWRLRAPPGQWRARSVLLAQDWVASVVWCGAGDDAVEPVWHAARGCPLPAVKILL